METLAHGSGIDDAILVLLPLALVIVILRVGARRAPPEEEPADGTGPAAPGERGEPGVPANGGKPD